MLETFDSQVESLPSNWLKTGKLEKPFDLPKQVGIRVCNAMARLGVLTRPIGNVIVIMPVLHLTVTGKKVFNTLRVSIKEVT